MLKPLIRKFKIQHERNGIMHEVGVDIVFDRDFKFGSKKLRNKIGRYTLE